jgi:DNA invertase Pin-like site-specific DNA recombinase
MIHGYVRVSTAQQDYENQRHEIMEYAKRNDLTVDSWIKIEISSRKTRKERRIDEMLLSLQSGDTLIVSELSRLGRSTSEVINIVNELMAKGIYFIAIKQNIKVNGNMDMTSKIMITLLSLFAELERDIISERTKSALQAKKAAGQILGKPIGTLQASSLDVHKDYIGELLALGCPVYKIANSIGTSRQNLTLYIKTRGIK